MNTINLDREFDKASAMLSQKYIEIYALLKSEEKKKENSEEYNERIVENGTVALMHLSHSIGELIEAKACLMPNLSPIDILCKKQYEQELDEALECMLHVHDYSGILDEELKD